MTENQSRLSRREFLNQAAAVAAGGALLGSLGSCKKAGQEKPAPSLIKPTGYDFIKWDRIYETIIKGFVTNALRTSDSFAVCDYRQGLILNNFLSIRGMTCDSVTRILPALAAGIVSADGRKSVEVDGKTWSLENIFLSALRHATDPRDKDFWGYARRDDSDQRQVESSIVAFSLWLTADRLMDRFSPGERENLQKWLESCTVYPVRQNNWALFTAVNHAARIALSGRWKEFRGDQKFFLDDLAAIDSMYQGDGWYHDSLDGQDYDYYNFWVFASHNMYWDMMVGERFPELRQKFRERLRKFLETTPFFFGSQGSHIFYGRSLIYRWAVLTPLVLSHSLDLWPYSTGLLRRICSKSLAFLWESGAWDEKNEKLRETMTPNSSREVCETYINNGHPYWGMQAFYAMSFSRDDTFWNAPEEPLPVEKEDFTRLIDSPGILIKGHKSSGQVEMWQSRVSKKYPNKYYNFSYSSHFPFNVETVDNLVPPDCMLSFEDSAGNYGRRDSEYTGRVVSANSLVWQWKAHAGETMVDVESMVFIDSELQWLAHRVRFQGSGSLAAVESTYALGLAMDETSETKSGGVWEYGRSPDTGYAVFIRAVFGFNESRKLSGFKGRDNLNSFHARAQETGVAAKLDPGEHVLIAAVYASPVPLPLEKLLAASEKMPREIADFAGLEG